jgi:hypothetical protein
LHLKPLNSVKDEQMKDFKKPKPKWKEESRIPKFTGQVKSHKVVEGVETTKFEG